MEPVPLCKGEIILKIEHRGQLTSLGPQSKVSSVIVTDPMDIGLARSRAKGKPVGLMIDASLQEPEAIMGRKPDWMIDQFEGIIARALRAKADFLYIRMCENLQILRAAVLAATDQSGIGIMAELPVGEDGCMPDGTPVLCALGILQRIGVAGLILTGDIREISETFEEIAPHAHVALGLAPLMHNFAEEQELPEAEFYLVYSETQAQKVSAVMPENDDTDEPEADRDYILAPVGRHVHFVDATIDFSDPMDMEDRFEETLLELEDVWSGAIKIEIESMEDIYLLLENQYLFERPVCLAAENPLLFEKALRVFNGIALYDGTWELDEDILEEFCHRYGLVAL